MVAEPCAAGEGAYQLAVQATRMVIVNIFDGAALFQAGGLQTASQGTVLFPQPLLIDQQGEALFKNEPAGAGVFQVRPECVGPGGQVLGRYVVGRGLDQYQRFLWALGRLLSP